MKWSKYNYFFKSPKYGYLLYNALTNVFLRMSEKEAAILQRAKINPSTLDEFSERNMLVRNKIFVENDEDEIAKLKVENLLGRFASPSLSLTITPTLACNFKCSYCYENDSHVETMSEEVQDKVLSFVQGFPSVKELFVTWYGGEPLLALDVIDRLTSRFRTLNLPLSAGMVTNGYLLQELVVRKLVELSIRSLQVTIDGVGERHDKRRPHRTGVGTFETIIANLDKLFTITKDLAVAVRVNIDQSNKDHFPELLSYLSQRYHGERLSVAPAFVERINGCCGEQQCIASSKEKAAYWMQLFQKYRIYNTHAFPKLELGSCMMRKLNAFVISADGSLYKCWNDIGRADKAVGSVLKQGLNTTLLARYLKAADKWDDPRCLDCEVFPICDGGCSYMRLENLYEGSQHDCCIAAKEHLYQFIENHYEMRKMTETAIK